MTIRLRLTLFYTLAMAVILLGFSLFLYLTMRFMIFREIDRKLELFADGMASSVRGLAVFNRVDERLRVLEGEDRMGVEVIAPAGESLFRTEVATRVRHNPARLTSRKTVRAFNYVIETEQRNVAMGGEGRRRTLYRVLTKKFFHEGRFVAWVQVAEPVDETVADLRRLKRILVPGTLFFLLLVSASGYALARESLRPVKSIIEAAGRIGDDRLSERIPVPASQDELAELIRTLNGLFDRLEASFRSQRRFISDAAHELKTPLAILRSNLEAEALEAGRGGRGASARRLAQNIDTLARLSGLVDKLLLLSRLENGRVALRQERLDMAEFLEGVAENAEFLFAERRQRFVRRLGRRGVAWVDGDRDLLHQAVLNLLSNAAKYTPKGEEVVLALEREGGEVRVRVADRGRGMTEEELSRAFDRFYRADEARSEGGGFGLGLSICRWIALLHGGRVELSSRLGEGTEAVLVLPSAGGAG